VDAVRQGGAAEAPARVARQPARMHGSEAMRATRWWVPGSTSPSRRHSRSTPRSTDRCLLTPDEADRSASHARTAASAGLSPAQSRVAASARPALSSAGMVSSARWCSRRWVGWVQAGQVGRERRDGVDGGLSGRHDGRQRHHQQATELSRGSGPRTKASDRCMGQGSRRWWSPASARSRTRLRQPASTSGGGPNGRRPYEPRYAAHCMLTLPVLSRVLGRCEAGSPRYPGDGARWSAATGGTVNPCPPPRELRYPQAGTAVAAALSQPD
jgi:hypothetical protein